MGRFMLGSFLVFAVVMLSASVGLATLLESHERTIHCYLTLRKGGTAFGPVKGESDEKSNLSKFGTHFGKGLVFDDAIRRELDISSQEIAYARGIYLYTHPESLAHFEVFTVTFNENSEFAGSSLSAQGNWEDGPANDGEFAIVGGTGVFKYSMGTIHFVKVDSESWKTTISLLTLKPVKAAALEDSAAGMMFGVSDF